MTSIETLRLAGDIIFPGVFFTERPENTASAVATIVGSNDDDAAVAWAASTLGLDEIDTFLIGGWDALRLENSAYSRDEVKLDQEAIANWFGRTITDSELHERHEKAADIMWQIATY